MDFYLKNYRHDVYPVSLYLILKKINEDIEQSDTEKNDNNRGNLKYIKGVMDRIDSIKIKGAEGCKEFCKEALKYISEYIEPDTWDYYASIVLLELNEQV